jgi:hypothetical protein
MTPRGVKVLPGSTAQEVTRPCEVDVKGKSVPVRQSPGEYDFCLTLCSTVVTICTACFNIKSLHSAHTMYLCVPYGSHNKQQLFPQTVLTGWAM